MRLISAQSKFLNADEAMHYLLAMQPTLAGAYRASLGTAHPPLLIIFLHYWGMISHSEIFLRLPSVVAGTTAGWFVFAWLREVSDRRTALIAMSLVLFSPALIYTSAEVRQYALLLCFMSATLYFLDRGFIAGSVSALLASALTLYLAMLTHYAAMIFAASIAVYGLLRILRTRPKASLISAWICSQAGAVAIAALLWKTHISVIRHRSLTRMWRSRICEARSFIGEKRTYSHFWRGRICACFISYSARVQFLCWRFMLFIVGLRDFIGKQQRSGSGADVRVRGRSGILLLLPFLINCGAALIGAYPYGGTRHDSYLAIFAMPAVAVAIARWKPSRRWVRPLTIAFALAICNFTVVPAGSYVRPNQKREFMEQAAAYLRGSAAPGSIVLTDYESGLLLSYYVCGSDITHTGELTGYFYFSRCGEYEAASLLPRLWVFRAETFSEASAGVDER